MNGTGRQSLAPGARLVDRRNDIAHALPRFVSGDVNTMHRRSTDWTVEAMEDAADEFTVCCQALAALFHDHLRGASAERDGARSASRCTALAERPMRSRDLWPSESWRGAWAECQWHAVL